MSTTNSEDSRSTDGSTVDIEMAESGTSPKMSTSEATFADGGFHANLVIAGAAAACFGSLGYIGSFG